MEKLPDEFNMVEIMNKVPPEERTPYVVVAFQETERMNGLTNEMKRSLKELDLGLKVCFMCKHIQWSLNLSGPQLSGHLFWNQSPFLNRNGLPYREIQLSIQSVWGRRCPDK